jgi:uncharacterized protein YbjT (DUF2867 family)
LARVLIVGCGCRGRALAQALAGDGHAVRGTTRSEDGRAAIEGAGIEPVIADPDRLGTMMAPLEGITVLCWLLGSAAGEREHLADLHGPRLRSMLELIVDTPVRSAVYEAAGSAPSDLLEQGAAIAREASDTFRMPVATVEEPVGHHEAWVEAHRAAVAVVLDS